MINRTHQEQVFAQDKNSSSEIVCGEQHVWSDVSTDGPFMYSNTQQSLLLSSYYYGYCLFSIAGGYVVHNFGIRKTVTVALLAGGLLSLLIPELLKTDEGNDGEFFGLYATTLIRALIGSLHVGKGCDL
jgi:MFS family permease